MAARGLITCSRISRTKTISYLSPGIFFVISNSNALYPIFFAVSTARGEISQIVTSKPAFFNSEASPKSPTPIDKILPCFLSISPIALWALSIDLLQPEVPNFSKYLSYSSGVSSKALSLVNGTIISFHYHIETILILFVFRIVLLNSFNYILSNINFIL